MSDRVLKDLIDLAEFSDHPKQKVAAIITDKRGIPLASATNLAKKTHPKQAYFAWLVGERDKVYLHAEMAALIRNKSEDARYLHVLRLGRDEKIRMAKPCAVCMEGILADGDITDVFYSTNETHYTHAFAHMKIEHFTGVA